MTRQAHAFISSDTTLPYKLNRLGTMALVGVDSPFDGIPNWDNPPTVYEDDTYIYRIKNE